MDGDYLSFATMFVQSNDLFYAPEPSGIPLFDGETPVDGDMTEIENAVLATAPDDLTAAKVLVVTPPFCECPDGSSVTCTGTCSGGAERGVFITIRLEDDYFPLLPYPGFPSTWRLAEETTVRLN